MAEQGTSRKLALSLTVERRMQGNAKHAAGLLETSLSVNLFEKIEIHGIVLLSCGIEAPHAPRRRRRQALHGLT
jgi:hypothetical protein